jgi:hypothetical protein
MHYILAICNLEHFTLCFKHRICMGTKQPWWHLSHINSIWLFKLSSIWSNWSHNQEPTPVIVSPLLLFSLSIELGTSSPCSYSWNKLNNLGSFRISITINFIMQSYHDTINNKSRTCSMNFLPLFHCQIYIIYNWTLQISTILIHDGKHMRKKDQNPFHLQIV